MRQLQKIFFQNENMGPLQENHSHNGPKKRRRLLLVFPIQQTRPVGHTPQSPRSAPSDGVTLQICPIGLPNTLRPMDSPGRASVADFRSAPSNGATRQVLPRRAPQRLRPTPLAREGKRRRLPPAAAGGINSNPFFDRLRRPKNSSQPESAGFAGAGLAASPKFGMGHPPDRQPDSLVRCPPNEDETSAPIPNFKTPRCPRCAGGAARPGCWRCR